MNGMNFRDYLYGDQSEDEYYSQYSPYSDADTHFDTPEEKFLLINDIIGTLNVDELDEFGYWLYCTYFEYHEDEADYAFDIIEVRKMIILLGQDYYDEILDELDPEGQFVSMGYFTNDGSYDDWEYDGGQEYSELGERASRIVNRKSLTGKRKKFRYTDGENWGQQRRRILNPKNQRKKRENRQQNRRYWRSNRIPLLAQGRDRRNLLKKNRYVKKDRKGKKTVVHRS